MVSIELRDLRVRGNELFEQKEYNGALQLFKDAIGIFLDKKASDFDSVEEFVKIAGNLCICYHTKGDLDDCFTTARELLATYPIIPKAYGAIGMCVVDRLKEQEAANPTRTGEELRRDPLRYVVKVAGIQCSVDEAHSYLSRAVLLSKGALQVSLGPYIETAVRLISEQLLSAGQPIERELGRELLDHLCPPETRLPRTPNTLTLSKPEVSGRVRVYDALTGEAMPGDAVSPPEEIRQALRDADQEQQQQQEAPQQAVAEVPVDFMLSMEKVAVRVCHSERGGLPRGLALARAELPFAAANWLVEHKDAVVMGPADPSTMGETVTQHVDPATGLEVGMVMMPEGGMPTEAPATMCCVACGKEMIGSQGLQAVACATCDCVRYCSPSCAESYCARHERYECALYRALLDLAASATVRGGHPTHQDQAAEGATDHDVLPGSGWKVSDMLHKTLPLCFSVFSGLQTKEDGWEQVVEVLQRGVHLQIRSWIPSAVVECIQALAPLLATVEKLPLPVTDSAEFLQQLLLTLHLYGTRRGDSEGCALFTQRLKFRHSCEPNCGWSDAMKCVTTNRFIFKGEELTVAVDSAFPQHWPLQIRRKWLSRYHGFICTCSRCTREEHAINHARGDLSNDLTEQLLTADCIPKTTSGNRFPTHQFHTTIHACIPLAVQSGPKADEARKKLVTLREEAERRLICSHYLFEDIRKALLKIAMEEDQNEVSKVEGRNCLLFLESMWAGSIPAKVDIMQSIPMVFDTRRRRSHPRQMRRRQREGQTTAPKTGDDQPATAVSTAAAATSAPTASSSAGTNGTSASGKLRRAVPERDFSEGTIVDLFYGSYHAWYCL